MSEEVRFFFRVALYTLAISVVYWFVSYEIAGSVMLLALGLSAVYFTATMLVLLKRPTDPESIKRGPVAALRRWVGFDEPGDASEHPMNVEEDPIPASSAWPLVVALGAMLVGLGLIYGGWMWIPGAVLLAVSAWGWVTQLEG